MHGRPHRSDTHNTSKSLSIRLKLYCHRMIKVRPSVGSETSVPCGLAILYGKLASSIYTFSRRSLKTVILLCG